MDKPTILNGGLAVDDRGSVSFVNDFNFKNVKRFYQVQNHRRGFIRAWHGHKKEGKYVYVASGTALVGAVPMPEDGVDKDNTPKTFVISAKSPKILYIPPNYANGFMNLEDDTIIQFFSTSTLDESLGDDIRFEYDKWDIWKEDFR
tara:strand:- start:780 stop:1217 length:438 start_codon:yes stop_codon:yes gene_type:complete